MPGSVQNAVSATVFPWELTLAFAQAREYPLLLVEYEDGHAERALLAATSRKRWELVQRLTPAQVTTLRDYYLARKGPLETFVFYDIYETVPKFSFDDTGVATDGKYEVRFVRNFELEQGIALGNTPIALIEVT